jgi:hypothetical protein
MSTIKATSSVSPAIAALWLEINSAVNISWGDCCPQRFIENKTRITGKNSLKD